MTTIPENDWQIIPRNLIEAKACRAFFDGLPRSSHCMNWHASALPVWLAAYDRCVIQYPHLVIGACERLDVAQEVAL